jgi:uncharacterized protein (DUF58 family)
VAGHRVTNADNDRPASGVAPVARKAAELRRLELLITRRLDGLLRGEFLGIRPGPGTDYAGTRQYEAGDDARRIDWNLTARSLAPFLRTTDADRELQTWVVVDRSASMNFGTAEREKSEVAFATVAAFGFLTGRHGNQFGVMTAGGERVLRLGPSSTRPALLATLARLYDLPRVEDPPATGADLASALRALERARPRRGQVVVISDFLDGSDWPAHLRRLAFAHQVLAVQVVDPRELELPAMGVLTLVDAETGRELRVQSSSKGLRERYAQAANERHDDIRFKIRDARSHHLVLTTDRDWLLDIVRYVAGSRTFRRVADPAREPVLRATQLRSVT